MELDEMDRIISAGNIKGDIVDVVSPFSVWIHNESGLPYLPCNIIEELLDKGCRFFQISGDKCRDVLDFVDSIVESRDGPLILTTSTDDSLSQAAEQFTSMRSPSGSFKDRLVMCLSHGETGALKIEQEMLAALELR